MAEKNSGKNFGLNIQTAEIDLSTRDLLEGQKINLSMSVMYSTL